MKKKLLSLILTAITAAAMLITASAVELDTAEADTPYEEAVLSSEWTDSEKYGTLLWGFNFNNNTTTTDLGPDVCKTGYDLYKNANARFGNSAITWGWSDAVTAGFEGGAFRLMNPQYGQLQFSMLTPANYGVGKYTLVYKFRPYTTGETYVKYDTDGTDYTSETVTGTAGVYTENAVSFIVDGSNATKINYIYIYTPNTPSAAFFDDICLYVDEVKAVNVTYDFNGSSIDGKTSAVMAHKDGDALYNPGYCFDHWEDADGNTVTELPDSDTTLYAVWAEDENLGTMIAAFDFEGTSSFQNLRPDYINDDYDFYDEQSWQNYSTVCRENGTGGFEGNAVTITGYGTNNPDILFSTSPQWKTAGTYTVVYDFKGVASSRTDFTMDTGVVTGSSTALVNSTWTNASYSVEVGGESGNTSLNYIRLYAEDASNKAYFDNIKIYVKEPAKAEVTFDYNGLTYNGNTSLTEKILVGEALPSGLVCYPYELVEWQDASGKVHTTVPEEDITLKAIWKEDRAFGKLRMVFDFNTKGAYDQAPAYSDGIALNVMNNTEASYLTWVNAQAIAIDGGAYRVTSSSLGGIHFYPTESITEEGKYFVSAKVKGAEIAFVRFTVVKADGTTELIDVHRYADTDDFATISADIVIGGEQEYTAIKDFGVYSNTSGATVYFDDVKLYEYDRVAPEAIDLASIRTNSDAPAGIRFASFIDEKLRNKSEEYGFIVTVSDYIMGDESYLVFNEAGDRNTSDYVSGAAYIKSEGIDIIYSHTAEPFEGSGVDYGYGFYFTCVLTGITAEQYDTQLMVRPYVKVNGNFFYGASVTRSIYEVAEDMKEKSYDKLSDESKKVIDNILEYNEFDAE